MEVHRIILMVALERSAHGREQTPGSAQRTLYLGAIGGRAALRASQVYGRDKRAERGGEK